MMRSLSLISTTLVGLLLVASAFLKAWDADTFAHVLQQYGAKGFSVAAPVLIFTEAVLGMLLLLRVQPRKTARAAVIFLVIVSLGFAYGVLFQGIEDCGCFGELSYRYATKPWMTFARNAVLLCIALPPIFDQPIRKKTPTVKILAAMIVGAAACFCCGLSMNQSFRLPRLPFHETEDVRPTMDKLLAVYPFSTDSSYVVYLFSFSCSYCQNSFANVQQYQQFKLVDKVLGVAVEDEKEQERFFRIYQPQIDILTIPKDTMAQITSTLPIALLIQANYIRSIESGLIASPGIFMK